MRRRSRGRFRRVGPARALLVSGLLVVALTSSGGREASESSTGGPTNGPVKLAGADSVLRAGMESAGGGHVLFGAATVENTGTSTATLRAAQLLGDISPEAAEVDEVRIVDLGAAPGTGDLLGASTWPERGWKHWWENAEPIDGAQLEAGRAAELVLIIAVHETGDWYWPRTAVDYAVGDDSFTTVTNFGFQACRPAPAECSEIGS